MDSYTVTFRQMAGGGQDLTVEQHELDHLTKHGLVEVRALKIRRALIPELAKFYTSAEEDSTSE